MKKVVQQNFFQKLVTRPWSHFTSLTDCLVCRLGLRLPLLLEVGSLRTSFIELYIINCCSPKNGNIMKALFVIGIIQWITGLKITMLSTCRALYKALWRMFSGQDKMPFFLQLGIEVQPRGGTYLSLKVTELDVEPGIALASLKSESLLTAPCYFLLSHWCAPNHPNKCKSPSVLTMFGIVSSNFLSF